MPQIDALGKDAVFVQGDQRTQNRWGEPIGEDGARWAIALEDAVRHKSRRRPLGGDLGGRLAEGECLRLREEVCHQEVMMAVERIECL